VIQPAKLNQINLKAKFCPGHPDTTNHLFVLAMHASLIRRQLGGIVPPKIATPSLLVRALVLVVPRLA